jgi:murein tripeptide amidase MpaA
MQQGENVRYKKVEREDGTRAWYLTFDFTFLHDNDEVFFAACPPYSYSFLLKEVEDIVQGSRRKCRMDVDRTNKSICGLDIPILTITHNNFDESQPCNYIVVIARSHPGESASSWVINGMLKHFASADPSLDDYPRNLVIKLVPMVNVDGVFLGNYRTGVMGKDFNRKFASARSNLFPEI